MNEFKSYREKELTYFLVFNTIMLFQMSELHIKEFNNHDVIGYVVNVIPLISLPYFGTLILDFLIPSNIKKVFVLFFKKSQCDFFREPGEVIFDKLLEQEDYRISKMKVLDLYKRVYSKMPSDKLERYQYQNNEFCVIYKKHEKKEKIQSMQKEYLLCRDMVNQTICIFVLSVLLDALQLINVEQNFYWYCIFCYIVLVFCTRQKADAFVKNTIIEDVLTEVHTSNLSENNINRTTNSSE